MKRLIPILSLEGWFGSALSPAAAVGFSSISEQHGFNSLNGDSALEMISRFVVGEAEDKRSRQGDSQNPERASVLQRCSFHD